MSERKDMKLRDAFERLFWTAVASVSGSLPMTALIDALMSDDMDTAKRLVITAATTAATTTANGVLIIARHRMASLPDPGDGMPGLPTVPSQ